MDFPSALSRKDLFGALRPDGQMPWPLEAPLPPPRQGLSSLVTGNTMVHNFGKVSAFPSLPSLSPHFLLKNREGVVWWVLHTS